MALASLNLGNCNGRTECDIEKIVAKPWVRDLLSTVHDMSKKAVFDWANIISHIGERTLDLDGYTKIFIEQLQRIFDEMIAEVEDIQDKRIVSIASLLQRLENVCKDLAKEIPTFKEYEERPLCDVYENIYERVKEFEAVAEIQKKEVRELNDKQLKLCKNLGKKPKLLPESPLPSPVELEELRAKVEALENDALEREERYFHLKEEITKIVEQLGVEPSLNFEREILDLTNTEVRIGDSDLEQLTLCHDRLVKQYESVKEEVGELRQKIDSLWDKLETDIGERDTFRSRTPGNSLETLKILKEEVLKLEEKKKANIRIFIEKQREELTALWNKCHCTDDDKKTFPYFFSDCYNEDLFDLHEMEIQKWRTFYSSNEEIFTNLTEYTKLWNERLELEQKSEGPNRYKNRGGKLLVEEKQRNKLHRRIPKYEDTLLRLAEAYLARKGEDFFTFGLTIPQYISKLHTDAENDFKLRLSAKKQQRDHSTAPASSRMNLFPVSPGPSLTCRTNLLVPPSPALNSKRKLAYIPSSVPTKKSKQLSVKKAPNTGLPKLNVSKNRYKRRSGKASKRLSFTKKEANKENLNDTKSTNYDQFQNDMKDRNARSTEFGLQL